MTGLYRTAAADVTQELAGVRARYDLIAADLAAVRAAGPADPTATGEAARCLLAEARHLDAEGWQEWLRWCDDDTVLWVPLDTRAAHPGHDQSLFLDDRRRLDERVWRFTDPNAWSLHPFGETVRSVAGVEAWPDEARNDTSGEAASEILVASTLTLQHVRSGAAWSTLARQVHRLRSDPSAPGGWRLVHKVILLPQLAAGTPHLGWLM